MAFQLNLYSSNFDQDDKKEMIKRYQAELISKKGKRKNATKLSSLYVEEMALKVKEVLSQVPLSVIKTDIMKTQNIDDTIERILTGLVQYIPEESWPKESNAIDSTSSHSSNRLANTESNKLFYCGTETFGKTSFDRSKSFKERKEHLFRVARTRYLQKINKSKLCYIMFNELTVFYF